MKALLVGVVLLLTVSPTHADEYWRGWCAGVGYERRQAWIIERGRRNMPPLTPEQVEQLKKSEPERWYVHGQESTSLWNGLQERLWVTCPSGATFAFDLEQPHHGKPTPEPQR